MDLGLRARQTQHGESGEEETWELGWECVCVHSGFVCTQETHTHTNVCMHTHMCPHTHAHTYTEFGWTSVQMREY